MKVRNSSTIVQLTKEIGPEKVGRIQNEKRRRDKEKREVSEKRRRDK